MPAFVLTSLSFKPTKTRKKNQPAQASFALATHHSTIAKFDYCLPPEDNYSDAGAGNHLGS